MKKSHPDNIVIHDPRITSERQILIDFDDSEKIVIVDPVLAASIEFPSFFETGQKSLIKVQSYQRSVTLNGINVVKKDEVPPFMISCDQYNLCCDYRFKGTASLEREGEDTGIFKALLQDGKEMEIDIFETILYAIDIPMKLLSPDL